MLLYFWRFLFGMDINTIRRYSGADYPNGRIEAFRFACKRYLDMESTISNAGFRPVFESLIPEYEILLVSDKKGVCWFRDCWVEADIAFEAISEYERNKRGWDSAGF
jgi:hypothetical protein